MDMLAPAPGVGQILLLIFGIERLSEEILRNRRWMEVVASELFSARVAVSPKPSESDPSKVPTDPSRGRYKAAKDFGAPYGERLCKLVRTLYNGLDPECNLRVRAVQKHVVHA